MSQDCAAIRRWDSHDGVLPPWNLSRYWHSVKDLNPSSQNLVAVSYSFRGCIRQPVQLQKLVTALVLLSDRAAAGGQEFVTWRPDFRGHIPAKWVTVSAAGMMSFITGLCMGVIVVPGQWWCYWPGLRQHGNRQQILWGLTVMTTVASPCWSVFDSFNLKGSNWDLSFNDVNKSSWGLNFFLTKVVWTIRSRVEIGGRNRRQARGTSCLKELKKGTPQIKQLLLWKSMRISIQGVFSENAKNE